MVVWWRRSQVVAECSLFVDVVFRFGSRARPRLNGCHISSRLLSSLSVVLKGDKNLRPASSSGEDSSGIASL